MMRPWLKSLVALAMLSSGCGTIVIDPLATGEPGGPSSGSGSSSGSGPESGPPSAIAMYLSQWSSSPHVTGLELLPETAAPGDLMIFIASEAQSCVEPVIPIDWAQLGMDPSECASQAFWQAIVVIPASRVQPGVIDVAGGDIYMYRSIWGPECGGGYGYGAHFATGTLEIVSLDAASVSVTLDIDPSSGWPDPNGDYVASFCP